jgi:hypothetical protein
MSVCKDCDKKFDLDEGGFLWNGLVFCEDCDPEEPKSDPFEYRVWGFYSLELGKGQYAVYKMQGAKVLAENVGGKTWNFDQVKEAQAYCDSLNSN